jgi:hypothetical protein
VPFGEYAQGVFAQLHSKKIIIKYVKKLNQINIEIYLKIE